MIDKDKIIYEAQMYLDSDLSISMLASLLGISKKTIQNHFKQLETIDKDLYDKVQQKKEDNQKEGRVLGGQIGKATSKYSKAEIETIAKMMINQSFTYKEAEKFFKIPKSTIYELLHSGVLSEELIKELDLLANDNQRNVIRPSIGKK